MHCPVGCEVRKDEEGSSLIDFLFLQFWARDGPDPLSSELKVLKKWLWAACVWPRPAPGPCALWYPRAARPQTRPLRIPLIALIHTSTEYQRNEFSRQS